MAKASLEGRSIPPRVWTMPEIEKLLGYRSTKRIVRNINNKTLKASKRPCPGGFEYIVKHDDLCDWLLKQGFPLGEFRYLFNAGKALLAAGLTPAQVRAISGFNVIPTTSLFRLGQLTREHHAWAIIVSLPAVGDDGISMARAYAKLPGRPYLIALTGKNQPGRPADVFDLILREPCDPAALAAAVKRLKKWGDRTESE